ncbi:hypothetical protein TURU_021355 [Turdus rufiventris]|nr:hypothetical protein TURU_021355 [Turdus rufiventris]
MEVEALLLWLLLLSLLPLWALLRRGHGRGPRCGALHLLHPQGALHLSRLARHHGPVLRLRLGGRDVLVPSSVGSIREALVRHWGDWLGRPSSYLGMGTAGWAMEELRSHGEAPLDPSEIFTFHTCSTIARLLFGDLVPPPGELRAFSRCLGELLQVWGHSSVQVLDLLPLLRVLPNPGLRKLLRLVQHRDAFVEAQIRRHQATVSETLRLRPPAPLALPHCALRHTSLGGLPVVAGTVLVPNLLAAQQDPDIWQHPEVFLPGVSLYTLSPVLPWVHHQNDVPDGGTM